MPIVKEKQDVENAGGVKGFGADELARASSNHGSENQSAKAGLCDRDASCPLAREVKKNLSEDRWIEFEALKDQELKTSRAWAIKEPFRWLWEYRCAGNARKFFTRW